LLNNTTTPSFTDTSVSNGTTYYYKVSAYNGYGQGPLSNEVATTPGSSQSISSSSTSGPSSSSTGFHWLDRWTTTNFVAIGGTPKHRRTHH